MARQTIPSLGWIKGKPLLYKRFHHKVQLRPTTETAVPFKIDGVYCRLIPLTKGLFTIVWESDYWWLSQRSWYANWDKALCGFYARCGVRDANGRLHTMSMHRMILGLDWNDDELGDHRNGNTLDNRRDNLRIADEGGNSHNRKRQSSNKSGFKGVNEPRKNGIFCAWITVKGKRIYLGCSRDPKVAHGMYIEAAKKYHGKFARFQ